MSEKDEPKMSPLLAKIVSSHKDLRNARGKNKADAIERSFITRKIAIEKAIAEKKDELFELTDFGPNNTTDLTVGSKDFNSDKFVKQICDIDADLRELNDKLNDCKTRIDEFFD